MFLVVLQNATSALTLMISKAALQHVAPIFFVALRMLGGGMLLLGYQYFFNRDHFVLPARKDLGLIVQIAFFQLCITFVFTMYAIKAFSAARAALMYNIAPFIAAFFSWLMFDEVMTKKKYLGVLIGFVGTIPMLVVEDGMTGASYLSGVGLMLFIAVVCNVYGYTLIRTLVKFRGYAPLMVVSLAMPLGGIF